MKKLLLLTILFVTTQTSDITAQGISSKLKQAKWVKIMANDSLYNYFEAEAEFKKFHVSFLKEKMREEKRRERKGSSSNEEHLESPEELLVADYLKWAIQIQPFVLANGTIMPLVQRLAIIKQTRENQQPGQ
ncbi:MAG: hypothetical protein V4722_00435 [Bacteroidota bacterium]